MQTSNRFRYVDDYEIVTTEGKRGKKKKSIRYIGEWVCILDDVHVYRKKVWLTRCIAIALLIGSLMSVGLNHSASRVVYVILPTVIALFPVLYLLVGLIDLKGNTAPMEKRSYELGIRRIARSGMGTAVIFCISLIAYLVFRILPPNGLIEKPAFALADIGFLFGNMIAILSGYICFHLMRSVRIERRENEFIQQNRN